MKINIKFKPYYLALNGILLVINFCSCKKFVQVDPPSSQLVTATVFNSDFAATSALTAIYTRSMLNSSDMALYGGILSDELRSYATTGTSQYRAYINAMDPVIFTIGAGCWTKSYSSIYQANAIMEALSSNNGVSAAARSQLTGEAKFIRAFAHFYLTNNYGDVPLVTTTDYTINAKLSRTPRIQVYQQIIADLKDAQGLLNNGYVDFGDTANASAERVRPNKYAATALLARAYLYAAGYTNNAAYYDSAAAQATVVINNTVLYDTVGLNNVFLRNSKEAIWQLQTSQPSGSINTPDGDLFILTKAPGNINTASISALLLSAFESGDRRRTNWVHDTTIGTTTYSYPFKYKVTSSKNPSQILSEYVMVLRLGEQYLVRAEALARRGTNIAGAIADLNVIRQRAGLPAYSGPVDQASAITAILQERRVELFTEWGHRWFDLNRSGTIDAVMGGPGGVTAKKGGIWDSPKDQLWPIPQTERGTNSNLSQNPGY